MQTTTTAAEAAALSIPTEVLDAIAADPAAATAASSIGREGSIKSHIRTTDPTVVVTVYTMHLGNGRYAVHSQVNAERHLIDQYGTSALSAPMSARSLRVQRDVKRRSAKVMREAHAAALTELVDQLTADPQFLAGVFANVPGPRD